MIEVEVKYDVAKWMNQLEDRVIKSVGEAAKLYREAVQQSLGTEAKFDREHAMPGFPRLKHTGDLQRNVHYVGGKTSDGNIYFEVFLAMDYGITEEQDYPVMEPVFEKSMNVLIQIMSSPENERQGFFYSPNMFALQTKTWFTKEYEHNESMTFPELDLEKRVQSY